MFRARFTREALEIITPAQIEAVIRLMSEYHEIEVRKAFGFSLPEGWLEFELRYYNSKGEITGAIEGGISPEGDTHT